MATRRLLWVVEDFGAESAARQLLDRFLIGYPQDGVWHQPAGWRHSVVDLRGGDDPVLTERADRYGLTRAGDLSGADAVVVVRGGRGVGDRRHAGVVREILEQAQPPSACYVHGLPGRTGEEVRSLIERAGERRIRFDAGTVGLGLTELPPLPARVADGCQELLWVGPAPYPEGLPEIMGALAGRGGRLPRVVLSETQIAIGTGEAVWEAMARGSLPADLFEGALSRTDNAQGDALRDGRTQNLWGLGLVPRMARAVRHVYVRAIGCPAIHLVFLEGVIGDECLALRTRLGRVVSTQLYRPPRPALVHYSAMAGSIERFLGGADGTDLTEWMVLAGQVWERLDV